VCFPFCSFFLLCLSFRWMPRRKNKTD
jgi:hypothetical protein